MFNIHNLIPGNRRDEYTPFRPHFRRTLRRSHHNGEKIESNVSLQDLKEQWENQKGRCIYTGVELEAVSPYEEKGRNPNRLASLDRIDSSTGYVKGNIQWISVTANYAKNKLTHEQMLEFCRLIREDQA